MALPALVKQELQALQTYYKSLYFLRWLLPTKLRKQLNLLESMTLDGLHPNSGDFSKLSITILALQHSLHSTSWYTRLIVYWFSGFHRFAQGELMSYTALLRANNERPANLLIEVALRLPSFKQGVEGLLLYKATGIEPHITSASSPFLQVSAILQVRECKISDDLKKNFYLKIAQRPASLRFAELINLLLSNEFCHAYIPTLIESRNHLDLTQALLVLATNDLLNPSESIEPAVQKTIIDTIITDSQPLRLARAVAVVAQHKIVHASLFQALKTSERPEELAALMVKFHLSGRLSLLIIPKLELHRITLLRLAGYCGGLSEQHRLDVDYCSELASWIQQEGGLKSPHLVTIYDRWLTKFSENPEQKKRFFEVLNQLNHREIWQGPCSAAFSEFLTQSYSDSNFIIYAKLLSILAKQPIFFTQQNHAAIFRSIQSCSQPDVLLLKCYPSAPATAHALQVLIMDIFDAAQPRVTVQTPSLSVSSISGMGHREMLPQDVDEESRITEPTVEKPSDLIEKQRKAYPAVNSAPDSGLIGILAGSAKQLLWSEAVTATSKQSDETSDEAPSQPYSEYDVASMV